MATTPIWQQTYSLGELNELAGKGLARRLGIKFIGLGDDYIRAEMPVDERTRQPFGLLHGGASVALAETMGSVASLLCVSEDKMCVGVEINANHIKAVREGVVTGKASPLHLGRSTQVWSIEITSERCDLVCVSRLTMAVVNRR